jgi:Ca2+-binding EF-hand superfamily protein
MAAVDRNRDGIVAVGELADSPPDRDGDGTLSVDELRESLDVDPWSVHADELEGMQGPPSDRTRRLARDVDHAVRSSCATCSGSCGAS